MAQHAYWVILAGTTPTAFRASTRDVLVPTLRQLQRTQSDVTLRWFERGRLWESPEAARFGLRATPPREPRGEGWRPGGEHRDPRAKFELSRDERRARFKARARHHGPKRPFGPGGQDQQRGDFKPHEGGSHTPPADAQSNTPSTPSAPAGTPPSQKPFGPPHRPKKPWSGHRPPRKPWHGGQDDRRGRSNSNRPDDSNRSDRPYSSNRPDNPNRSKWPKSSSRPGNPNRSTWPNSSNRPNDPNRSTWPKSSSGPNDRPRSKWPKSSSGPNDRPRSKWPKPSNRPGGPNHGNRPHRPFRPNNPNRRKK